MGMTRVDAIDYLTAELGTLLTDAGVSLDAAGLDSVVDDALLLMGVAYGDLPAAEMADADVIGYRAVLAYAGLRKAYRAVVNRVSESISLGTPSVSRSTSRNQIADSIGKLLALAKADADQFIVEIGDGAFSVGTVRLGMTEPCAWPS